MLTCFLTPINLSKPPSSILQTSLIFPTLSSSSMDSSFALPKLSTTAASLLSTASVDRRLLEEEEDSSFELEFTLPEYHDIAALECDCDDQNLRRIGDFISCEKPDPRTVRSKPQSPMSILRQSAPKLRVFMFGKPVKRSKPDQSSSPQASNGSRRKTRVNFTVKLRFEKKFNHSNSFKRSSNGDGDKELDGFCKKYLNLLKKPLYVKLSNTNSTSNRKHREAFVAASPRKSEERANRSALPVKTFGKCRSAGALLVGASLPAGSKDDSLTQQSDGIQGAILHCKQSFTTSSKERRRMSRCSSDTSHEKSVQRSA